MCPIQSSQPVFLFRIFFAWCPFVDWPRYLCVMSGYVRCLPPPQYFFISWGQLIQDCGVWCDPTQALELVNLMQERLIAFKCRTRLKIFTSDPWECNCTLSPRRLTVPSPMPLDAELKNPFSITLSPLIPIANKEGPGTSQRGAPQTWEISKFLLKDNDKFQVFSFGCQSSYTCCVSMALTEDRSLTFSLLPCRPERHS